MPVFREDFLYRGEKAEESDLHDIEKYAAGQADSLLSLVTMRLVREVRRLQHELNDPNYLYASGRISRSAIICREAEADKLRERIKALETDLKSKS